MDKFFNDILAKKNITAVTQSSSKPTHIVSDTISMNVVD